MLKNVNFTDIHTHQREEGILSILNLFPDETARIGENKYCSIGVHPWYIDEKEVKYQLELVKTASQKPEIVALGETGLDKFAKAPMDLQLKVFKEHVRIAENIRKPLIIHAVKTYNEIIHLKKEMDPGVPWIVHGFNSKPEVAEMLTKHGIYLSFGKALLTEHSNAFKVVRDIPDDLFFLETDDADMKIREVYERAADARNENIDSLKEKVFKNFITLILKHG